MPMRTVSIWDGKTLMPRMISMSSVRPLMRLMRGDVRPHAGQGACVRLTMSFVAYRRKGVARLVRVVMTSMPSEPSGTGRSVSGSITSG
jgi:hypothetical protein